MGGDVSSEIHFFEFEFDHGLEGFRGKPGTGLRVFKEDSAFKECGAVVRVGYEFT